MNTLTILLQAAAGGAAPAQQGGGLSFWIMIIAIFAVSPDFNEAVSEYQIKHITGELNGTEGYTPPECATMKTNGICFNPDPLCDRIKHPLNYYRIKAGKPFSRRQDDE